MLYNSFSLLAPVSMFANELEEVAEDRAVFWTIKPEKYFHYETLEIFAKNNVILILKCL